MQILKAETIQSGTEYFVKANLLHGQLRIRKQPSHQCEQKLQ